MMDPWATYRGREPPQQERGWQTNSRNPRIGEIPEWDGKSVHRTTYFRKVEIWESTTEVPVEHRALYLLGKLTGDAFEKMESISPSTLKVPEGVELLKGLLIDAYEPIEDYRIGKIMDSFLDDFSRRSSQEVLEFNLCWSREIVKVEKIAGELPARWKAHLYLKKLRLNSMQRSQVLTGTLRKYTVDALQRSALTAFPTLRDSAGKSHGDGKQYATKHGKNNRFGNRFRRKRTHGTNEVHQEDPSDEPQSEESAEASSDQGIFLEEQGSSDDESSADSDLPPDLANALEESEAFLTRAKKQRAEIEKARGFFKKGEPKGGKEDRVKSLKGKLPCSKCGELGHWYKDPACPKFKESFRPKDKHRKKKKKKKRAGPRRRK